MSGRISTRVIATPKQGKQLMYTCQRLYFAVQSKTCRTKSFRVLSMG